jgi:hypothetical protein
MVRVLRFACFAVAATCVAASSFLCWINAQTAPDPMGREALGVLFMGAAAISASFCLKRRGWLAVVLLAIAAAVGAFLTL